MYVSVVPAIHSIRGLAGFTYVVPATQSVQVGEIVWIPWRKQIITGVVWQINITAPDFSVKTIINSTQFVLDAASLHFINWLANHYFISLSYAVKLFLPTIPKRKLSSKRPSSININNKITYQINKNQVNKVQKLVKQLLSKSSAVTKQTILYTSLAEVIGILIGLLKNSTKRIAIIVPEEQSAHILITALQAFTEPVLITHVMNKTQYWRAWQELFNHTSARRLFIGTKLLSLFPLHKVDIIVQLDAADSAHKQWDLNPRYHTTTVINYWSQLTRNTVLRFSLAPALEQLLTDRINTTLLDDLKDPVVILVDMTMVPKTTFYGLLSPTLLEQCNSQETIFLWFNNKGTGKFLWCKNCRSLLSDFITVVCPTCHSHQLVKLGHGTTSLAKELRLAFPERVIIELTKNEPNDQTINYQAKPIIIGTSYAFTRVAWSKITKVAVISCDQMLSEPTFRAAEHTLYQLMKLRNYGQGKLIIQTYAPQHTVFLALNEHYPRAWYDNELKQRKKYQLPPFQANYLVINTVNKTQKIYSTASQLPLNEANIVIDREL
ncbi:MAG: hypothetical protein WCW27_04095 [Patescibacteria group bacterium]|jgi:primosomal protein N' (replication factor Y)